MARPVELADLGAYQTSDKSVINCDLYEIPFSVETVAIYETVAKLAQQLKEFGCNVTLSATEFTALRPLTQEELDTKLKQEQQAWDSSEELYHQASRDPSSVKDYLRWSIDRHAKGEGHPAIDWDAKPSEGVEDGVDSISVPGGD